MPTRLQDGRGPAPEGRWSTGLLDCLSDGWFHCGRGFLCPCVVAGRNAEVVDGTAPRSTAATWLLHCILCLSCALVTSPYRTSLRRRYSLPPVDNEDDDDGKGGCGSCSCLCGDCATHCACHCCALLQETRELKVRGAIGRNAMKHISLDIASQTAMSATKLPVMQKMEPRTREPEVPDQTPDRQDSMRRHLLLTQLFPEAPGASGAVKVPQESIGEAPTHHADSDIAGGDAASQLPDGGTLKLSREQAPSGPPRERKAPPEDVG